MKKIRTLLCVCLSLLAVGSYAQKSNMQGGELFPVYGITLGVTTMDQVAEMGYLVERWDEESVTADVYDLDLWDHDDDGIPEVGYLVNDDEMPQEWEERLGFDWSASYRDWVKILENMGYRVRRTVAGPETNGGMFYASVVSYSPDSRIKIELEFEDGKGGKRSKNTLYSLRVEVQKHRR